MRVLLLVFMLVAVSAISDSKNAATNVGRPGTEAECVQLADAQDFGMRHTQRREFIQECIDPEFNYPDLL